MNKTKSTPTVAPPTIEEMRTAAIKVSVILSSLKDEIKAGVTLKEIDEIAKELIEFHQCKSENKGIKPSWAKTPFPSHLCTSVNNCIAHGIPTDYELKEGDIINLDIGIRTKENACGDSAISFPIGKISKRDQDLLKYANRTCYKAIEQLRHGVKLEEIGRETMMYAASMGYTVNWSLGGHGISNQMHAGHLIPFHYSMKKEFIRHQLIDFGAMYKKAFLGKTLSAGEVVCIEPMVTSGHDRFGKTHKDGWSHLTEDGAKSAMFEHMVLITETGYEILTKHFDEA